MAPAPSPAPTAPQPLPARRHDITLMQKSHNNPAFTGLSNSKLITRITAALWDADVGLLAQPCTLDAKGNKGAEWITPYIRAVGHHRSGDIWIATAMEVGCNVLVERMDEWLPKLSDELCYSQKTYPVLVHGVPTSFNTSRDSKDVVEELIGENSDIITHPAAFQSTKFLGNTHGRMHQKVHGSLVIYFSDPTIANACINCHIALYGGLLPVVKFVHRPPCCFNCHRTSHLALSHIITASILHFKEHTTYCCRLSTATST